MRLLRRTTLCVVAVIAGLCASAAVAHAQTVASTTTVSVSPDPTLATPDGDPYGCRDGHGRDPDGDGAVQQRTERRSGRRSRSMTAERSSR